MDVHNYQFLVARRLIYDKSGPRWAMYLRKMGPGIVGMSAFVLADIITGVWDEPKSSI